MILNSSINIIEQISVNRKNKNVNAKVTLLVKIMTAFDKFVKYLCFTFFFASFSSSSSSSSSLRCRAKKKISNVQIIDSKKDIKFIVQKCIRFALFFLFLYRFKTCDKS